MTRFADAWVLAGLAALPLLFLAARRWVWPRRTRLAFSSLLLFQDAHPSLRQRLRFLPPALRAAALALLVVALARPQSGASSTTVESEGIDIVLALDSSLSMNAVDMVSDQRGAVDQDVSRLQVAKQAARDFILGRKTDRIGLVVFAGYAITQCPPTLDYTVLMQFLDQVQTGQLEDGTAIGTAIVTAVNRLREIESKSRVLVLLTDGANNAGTVDPITAAKVAKATGIRIYTIAAGREDNPRYPVDTFFGRQYVRQYSPVDEKSLEEIAQIGGGLFFRATSPEKLAEIYKRIGEMETTRVETKEYVEYSELAQGLVLPALVLLALEGLLANAWLRRLS